MVEDWIDNKVSSKVCKAAADIIYTNTYKDASIQFAVAYAAYATDETSIYNSRVLSCIRHVNIFANNYNLSLLEEEQHNYYKELLEYDSIFEKELLAVSN